MFYDSILIDDEDNAESGSGEIGNSSGEKTEAGSADEVKDKDTTKTEEPINDAGGVSTSDTRVFLCMIVGAIVLFM